MSLSKTSLAMASFFSVYFIMYFVMYFILSACDGYEVTTDPEEIYRYWTSDQDYDGRRVIAHISASEEDITSSNFIDVFLTTCEKNYARYHLYAEFGYEPGPFSQALVLGANLEGGIGVFGGYRMHRKRIDISRHLKQVLPSPP